MKIEITDNRKWQQSITLKIGLLAVMGLFLLIPLEMIKSIIRERQKNSEKVKTEIASQWAGLQTISGPILNIPVKINPSKKDAEPNRSVFHLMPDNLKIEGNVQTEKRHRSIYQAVVYTAALNLAGNFKIPEFSSAKQGEILWDEAYYTLGISDNRGLKGVVYLMTDSIKAEAVPGVKDVDIINSGISFPAIVREKDKEISFSCTITLSGSEELNFIPVGKTTVINIRSPWISPGFKGNFLPASRIINDKGFTAEWLITNLNRNFPQILEGNTFNISGDSFGVGFILQVDHYQKSLRSAKYGILFIALTFLALLFTEVTIKGKLNVFHYLLVSLALVLFFSLLNAVSEQLGFNLAYLISASSTILLITLFLQMLVRNYRPVLLLTGLLVFLYSFTFILLSLNDYAYLAGNIGLFVLLSVTMWISARFNFFSKETNEEISKHQDPVD
jgi:inner membrane protein